MRYRYTIKPTMKFWWDIVRTGRPLVIDQVEITCVKGGDGEVSTLIIDVIESPPPRRENGYLDPDPIIVSRRAYASVKKLADSIALEMGHVVIDPSKVFGAVPTLSAVSVGESELLKTQLKSGIVKRSGVTVLPSIESRTICGDIFLSSELNDTAINHYVNALEGGDSIHRYECLHKSLEALVPKPRGCYGEVYDQKVESALAGADLSFRFSLSEHRDVRNRCAHPERKDHLSKSDRDAVLLVREYFSDLQLVVRALLKK